MVERFFVSPNRVRGGGFLLDAKVEDDFINRKCMLSKTTETVFEEDMGVYSMLDAVDTSLTIAPSGGITLSNNVIWYPYTVNPFTVNVLLVDENNNGLADENVYFSSQDKPTVDPITTDSNGMASVIFLSNVGTYRIQCKFHGDVSPDPALGNSISNILNCKVGGVSFEFSSSSSELYVDKSVDLYCRISVNDEYLANAPIKIKDVTSDTVIFEGYTNNNGFANVTDVSFDYIGTHTIEASVGLETTTIDINVKPAIIPDLVSDIKPAAIQINEQTNITAKVTGHDEDNNVVPVESAEVKFYEYFNPKFVFGGDLIIQSGETGTLTAIIKDAADNSKIISPGQEVKFIELYDEIKLTHLATYEDDIQSESNIQPPGTSIRLKATYSSIKGTTGSLINKTVTFYEDGKVIGIEETNVFGEATMEYVMPYGVSMVNISCECELETSIITSNVITLRNGGNNHSEKIRIVWEDYDDENENRPASMRVYLIAGGTQIDTILLSENNNWEHIFGNLPEWTESEVQITYSFTIEEDHDFYTSSWSKDSNITTVTMTALNETVNYTLRGTIDDDDDSRGLRPDRFPAYLAGYTVYLTAANEYIATLTDIPKYKNRELYEPEWSYASVSYYRVSSVTKSGNTTNVTYKYWNGPPVPEPET